MTWQVEAINYFITFSCQNDSEVFLQAKGTVMGTNFALNYATIAMGCVENKTLQQIRKPFFIFLINNRKQFLDDCEIFWRLRK